MNNEPISTQQLKLTAEEKYREELQRLQDADTQRRPQGWQLSAYAVRDFILGNEKLNVQKKFYGDDALVDRALVTLMGNQGLMLVGEPGTAKSMLSELFSAAISGNSQLTIQGTAGTTEDHIKYSWNYALLLSEGPSDKSLIPSPLFYAMKQGQIARFEEITRCPPEIQDVLVSLMSEKQMMIPEMGQDFSLHAQQGFNLIATANLRDRGVHEMSSALKRRFNFETVRPINDRKLEVLRAIVTDYVASREPVGSKALVERHRLDVSAATVRNDMAALEAEGYIPQPHTSAGRIPTDKGYRLFVDRLAQIKPLSSAERTAIAAFLNGTADVDDLMARTVRLLAQLTRQVAIVQYPVAQRAVVRHVDLVPLTTHRLLVIVVQSTGRVD